MKVTIEITSTEVDALIFGASFMKAMREDFLKDRGDGGEFVARVAIAEELILRICTAAMKESPVAKAFIAGDDETYGAVSLFDDAGNAPMRGWAEPSVLPERPSVCLRANGESSWMNPDDARRLAAMLVAAATGINALGAPVRFRCWQPGNGQTRDDAEDIDALDEREAAELYAEHEWTSSDPFTSMDVRVAAWGSGTSSAFDVNVEVRAEPVFFGTKPRRVA